MDGLRAAVAVEHLARIEEGEARKLLKHSVLGDLGALAAGLLRILNRLLNLNFSQ